MRTKDLIHLADNPNFISGIYNYCDRWCERCPFTSRCLMYAMENEEIDDPASRDIRNAEFWRKLESILQQTREMISAWVAENGVVLGALESEIQEHRSELRGAEDHDVCVAAKDYAASVDEWFAEEALEVQGADDRLAVDTEGSENDQMVNDATAVIRWYQYQIAAKSVRALMSRSDEEGEENAVGLPKDSDGSIKVALIAIDRSISGWRLMQISRPNRAGSILPLLLSLERLRQSTEQIFPEARDFIRPGFDENPDAPVN